MMSLNTIRRMSREAGRKAAAEGKTPYLVDMDDITAWVNTLTEGSLPKLPFPNLGDHEPEGWELVDTHFVDATGFGRVGEPALTIPSFISKIVSPGHGYAIRESGQFQVVIAEFKRAEV